MVDRVWAGPGFSRTGGKRPEQTRKESIMAGSIFYRERRKVEDGEKRPRFRVVAVHDVNLRVYSDHLRMSELEHLAEATGARLVELRKGKEKAGDGEEDD
jgi:hypothetical protein